MLKLLLFTGIRNAELVQLRVSDVDLQTCQLRITQGKGHKDRYVLFPSSFRRELGQYMEGQRATLPSPSASGLITSPMLAGIIEA
jgi:integrase/recombinase XerD